MARNFSSYLEHFGFSQRPFSLTPDPEFLFWSDSARGAYAMLQYGLATRSPITMLTGEIGAGKTVLLQHFMPKTTTACPSRLSPIPGPIRAKSCNGCCRN